MQGGEPVLLAFADDKLDEVDQILDALRHMVSRTTSPMVRTCLEDAIEEIAHLTNHDEISQGHQLDREVA